MEVVEVAADPDPQDVPVAVVHAGEVVVAQPVLLVEGLVDDHRSSAVVSIAEEVDARSGSAPSGGRRHWVQAQPVGVVPGRQAGGVQQVVGVGTGPGQGRTGGSQGECLGSGAPPRRAAHGVFGQGYPGLINFFPDHGQESQQAREERRPHCAVVS